MSRLSLLFLFVSALSVQGQTNFTGPGLVGCPEADYQLAPCTPEELPDACASRADCQISSVLPTFDGFVLIALPCDCATISGCPATCDFSETVPSTGNGTGLDFTGPGYLSCDYADWYETNGCAFLDIDPLCPTFLSCDMNNTVFPSLDATATTIYVPLFCECVVALDCPASCTKSNGTPPEPPIVSATLNFTGVGSVTCPFVDFFALQAQFPGQCFPYVLNNDVVSACGSCDLNNLDPIFEAGDEFVTLPLPCACLALYRCPDSCIFAAGTGSPVAIPGASNTTAPSSLAPSTAVAAPPTSPVLAPVAANDSAPVAQVSKPVAAPARSPIAPSNTTSAAAIRKRNTSIWLAVILGWMVL